MDEQMRDAFAKPITDWEATHPNYPDLRSFLIEMVKLAIDKAVKIDLGWKCRSCVISYDNEVIKNTDTGEIYMIGVPREKAAWILGLATLSWLTKLYEER
jgi:hypothetical protein